MYLVVVGVKPEKFPVSELMTGVEQKLQIEKVLVGHVVGAEPGNIAQAENWQRKVICDDT